MPLYETADDWYEAAVKRTQEINDLINNGSVSKNDALNLIQNLIQETSVLYKLEDLVEEELFKYKGIVFFLDNFYKDVKGKNLKEYGGFLAVGPSGTQYPRGYDPSQAVGGMYQGRRFDHNFDPFKDGPDPVPDRVHIEKIDQRVAGGMPLKKAIAARAKRVGMPYDEMKEIYNQYKGRHNQIKEFLGLTEEEISCRSDEGITVGLVDSFITNLRLFKDRDLSPQSVQEALLDVADDPDFKYFLKELKKAKEKAK